MTRGQHHPFFKDPLQKFPLRYGHSNNVSYTCSEEAYAFVKGGRGFLFHTKTTPFFFPLPSLWVTSFLDLNPSFYSQNVNYPSPKTLPSY